MTHGQKNQQQEPGGDAARRARELYLADLRATFNTPSGQRVLAALRANAGCLRPATVLPSGGAPIDPFLTHWRDGRRSLILEIDEHLATPEDKPADAPSAIR